MPLSVAFFKSILGNDFSKSAKGGCLKIDTKVILCKQQDETLKVVGSKAFSSTGVTNCDEFHSPFHGVDLTSGSSSDVNVIKACANENNRFPFYIIMKYTVLRRKKS